jgi:hypothetical protein
MNADNVSFLSSFHSWEKHLKSAKSFESLVNASSKFEIDQKEYLVVPFTPLDLSQENHHLLLKKWREANQFEIGRAHV